MAKTHPQFLFDFGSPNAFLSHRAIPAIEQRTGVKFEYVPVLLGGIFKATNNRSPAETLAGIRNKREFMQLETDLRRAVARGEFVVYYQPIVTVSDQRIVAFEALLRWLHPDKGLLAPESFLSVVEDTGMLASLSWWVLEQACKQARDWRNGLVGEPPLRMCVNVSAGMFRAEHAAQRLKNIVLDTGMRAQDLSLELTERDCMDHEDATQATLAELQRFGVKIHMDDFGTGYSSLSYLQRCAYDTVKIDRSFVQSLDIEKQSAAIIRTIVGLGEMLNINVVAEGVESQEQLEALVSLRCPEAQGYWFSRPVSPGDAGELLRRAYSTAY